MITTTYSLVEICKICSGKRLPKGCDFSETPTAYKYIRARDIKNGKIDGSDLVYISEEVQSKIKKYIVNTNDIVITIVGASVGDVAYVTSEFDGINLTENAVRLTEFDPCVNSKYLMYILNSTEYWELMQQIAGGAAQPKLGIYKIEAIKVHLPPKKVQDKIVDILCIYDDLIENNQKQIKLLEEAAQRLYKEWFVDLRFPGYETTPIINGIPEGWKQLLLEEVVPILTGKKDANFSTEDGRYPFFTCAQTPLQAPSYSFDCDAVILAGNGDFNVKLYRGQFEAYQRTYVLSPENTELIFLLYHAVNNSMAKLAQGASGSTIKFLTRGMIASISVYVPDERTLSKFNELSEAIQKQIEVLKSAVAYATEARDRLLPKLMNGEIEV